MSVTIQRGGWRTDKPPVNHVVEAWFFTSMILVCWTGISWQTADGDYIAANQITHWRER